jgi:hypothetical protein
MSKGHVFLAQNSKVDYIKQAYALALSIKIFNKENKTCLITNDIVPDSYKQVFDHIVPIPWDDNANSSEWKIENRWKIIYATPFEENIVYDVDMLLLESNDHWWEHLKNKDISFTTAVNDYRNNTISSDYYRKTFTENTLDNIYTGVFYFKKVKTSYEFFKWLEIIVTNWEKFYKDFLKRNHQKFCSLDLSAALALRFMEHPIAKGNVLTFTHMKPKIQGWKYSPTKWTDILGVVFDENLKLKVGNFQQNGIFHYVEEEFLTLNMIKLMEENYEKAIK